MMMLVAIGCLFGVLPDIDIIVSGLSRTAHRSPVTHSLLGAFLFTISWVAFYIGGDAVLAAGFSMGVPLSASSVTVFFAAFLHAVADTVSFSGCKALYPLSSRKFRGPVRYDDWAANTALMVVAIGVMLTAANTDLTGLL